MGNYSTNSFLLNFDIEKLVYVIFIMIILFLIIKLAMVILYFINSNRLARIEKLLLLISTQIVDEETLSIVEKNK